jgi:Flp pilus assembly protein TadD
MRTPARFCTFIFGMMALCVFSHGARAQAGNARLARPGLIHGLVRLPGGQAAPQGVMVNLENDPVGHISTTQTDSQGKFSFSSVASPGMYVIRAKHTGYRESVHRVDLTMSPNSYVLIDLQPLRDSSVPPNAMVSAGMLAIPENARRDFERGREQLLERKSAEKSIPYFQKAIESYASYAQAHFMLGTAFLETGKASEAQKSLEEAVRLDSKMGGAYLALGNLYSAQGRLGEAEKSLLRGLELMPEVASAHYELAKVYWAMARPLDAEKPVRKTLELQPAMASAHLLLGNVLLRRRDAPGALAAYQEYLRLEPNGPMAPNARDMVRKIEAALKKP